MPANPRETNVLFVPVCRQIPKIRLTTKHAQEYEDKRIVVVIDEWDATSRHPRGHYIRTIGMVGNIEVESEVILLENDVCISEFPQKVYRCLPKVGPNGEWDPSPADVKGRVDFRKNYRVFSVDPPGCKDIDDALHVRDLGNGKFELGVHIADVTHFVAPNNACDEEARFRGTSVYLVQKRIDMLPALLTTDLCSLVGHKERLAFSVVWLVDKDANILDTRFHKSVIKSCAAMTYAKAQEMIDDAQDNSDLAKDLRLMREMARKLRQRREDAGALVLASNEVIYVRVYVVDHVCAHTLAQTQNT
jgi:exosome complex exonuclease DIS3/RRP44